MGVVCVSMQGWKKGTGVIRAVGVATPLHKPQTSDSDTVCSLLT